ncbi:hypothetical protein KAYACHO_81 [Mycobacterium phage KayaCho]|uniref:hypothetical protein n=1 Tax=Mycobacterium phage KayaCho TaxID=1340830 RepID=UPI000387FA2C|nr:hypothetical protein N846_gp81 [Mycobacterium phage KayaCho]AGT12985.1 hypothetical protein KAYACHO_81 [Mycobacterium phage KayaCho]
MTARWELGRIAAWWIGMWLFLRVAEYVFGLPDDVTDWSWTEAFAVAGALLLWDWWKSTRPTDRRHFDVRETTIPTVDLDPGAEARVSIIGYVEHLFGADSVTGPLSMAFITEPPGRMKLRVTHDLVTVHDEYGRFILSAANPEHRVGPRMSVGVLIEQVSA